MIQIRPLSACNRQTSGRWSWLFIHYCHGLFVSFSNFRRDARLPASSASTNIFGSARAFGLDWTAAWSARLTAAGKSQNQRFGENNKENEDVCSTMVCPQHPSVIWDYLSSKGGHVQHFTQQGRRDERRAQTWTFRDKAEQTVMKNRWYRDLLLRCDLRTRALGVKVEGKKRKRPR